MKRDTSDEAWMKKQGIPIVEAHGVEDVGALPLKPWTRTGGRGAFIQLKGMEGFTGMYVSEIPPAGALEPEKHLYEELVYVLQGAGSTEVWSADDGKAKLHFEWQQGSLFAVPLNCWHKFYNGSRGPALLLSVTTAPIMIDLLHDEEFVFGCGYRFAQRYDGRADYFTVSDKREERGGFISWETNFIADARSALVDPSAADGAGGRRAHAPPRRVARRPLSQGALPPGRRDPADPPLAGLHAHVAPGGGRAALQERPRPRSRQNRLARGQRAKPADRLVPPALQHRRREGARAAC